jgi:hypothetical protein
MTMIAAAPAMARSIVARWRVAAARRGLKGSAKEMDLVPDGRTAAVDPAARAASSPARRRSALDRSAGRG